MKFSDSENLCQRSMHFAIAGGSAKSFITGVIVYLFSFTSLEITQKFHIRRNPKFTLKLDECAESSNAFDFLLKPLNKISVENLFVFACVDGWIWKATYGQNTHTKQSKLPVLVPCVSPGVSSKCQLPIPIPVRSAVAVVPTQSYCLTTLQGWHRAGVVLVLEMVDRFQVFLIQHSARSPGLPAWMS